MIGLLVAGCGALGAVARFLVDLGVRRAWPHRFPIATLGINITGSLVLGAVVAATAADSTVGLAVGVGFCGGYTTFSTAMVETVTLLRERRRGAAGAYLLGLPIVCVLAAAIGFALVPA